MSSNIMGRAIGNALSTAEGITAVYLPDGASDDFAISIVSEANKLRKTLDSPPFAILVESNSTILSTVDCPVVSSAESLKYRKDDRLVVLHNSPTELASFENSTSTAMESDYPENSSMLLASNQLSTHLAIIIANEAHIDNFSQIKQTLLSSKIQNAMDAHHKIHSLSSGTRKWNAIWLESVERGLKRTIEFLKKSLLESPDQDFEESLTILWSAFGLPIPQAKHLSERDCRDVVEALEAHWSTEERATMSVDQLATHPQTSMGVHPLSTVSWEGFDELVAGAPNQFASLHEFLLDGGWQSALRETTLRQFIHPDENQNQIAPPYLTGLDGECLEVEDTGHYILSTELDQNDHAKPVVKSLLSQIILPVSDSHLLTVDQLSSIKIDVEGRENSWVTDSCEVHDMAIHITGYFLTTLPKHRGDVKFGSKTVRLKSPNSSIQKISNLASSIKIVLIPPTGPSATSFAIKGKTVKKVFVSGNCTYDSIESIFESSDPYTVELNAKTDSVVVYVKTFESVPVCNGHRMKTSSAQGSFYFAELPTTGTSEIEMDGEICQFVTLVNGPRIESPLLAAIKGQLASPDISSMLRETVQGRFETLTADLLMEDLWTSSLGHVALPEKESFDFQDLVSALDAGVLTTPGICRRLPHNPQYRVRPEILSSTQLAEFISAFNDLGVRDLLASGPGEPGSGNWASKTSWKHLVSDNQEALDRYLLSYADLVDFAREINDPYSLFWASYPFSLSTWRDQGATLECTGVLLSPLHPLRLNWIASTENVLSNSDFSESLAGTVEGWNFPLTGSGPASMSRLVAVPVDPGPGQLFLGWSMMVPISLGAATRLQSPANAGSFDLPGSSAGGLNGPITKSALRTYRRLAPQVSTLVVDMASSTNGARINEVDIALLEVSSEWIGDSDAPLIGGVRVSDSARRAGRPPTAELEALIKRHPGTPITWSRYDPDASNTPESNVRFLNDAASLVAYMPNPSPNLGFLGEVPLKRFTITSENKNYAFQTESFPLIVNDSNAPFNKALNSVEQDAIGFKLASQLSPELLGDTVADWTVTGEVFLSPTSVVSMLEGPGSGERMLWEWRPPFLNQDNRSEIELQSRPFISITRVSEIFKINISRLIEKATGRAASKEQVNKILSQLGTRGIGLSTLLSMGGNQALGAIGFYLALSLCQDVKLDKSALFVLPIDACDSFLASLLDGGNTKEQNKRRADLLAVRISEEGVTFVPIEIKCYGLGTEKGSSSLPKLGSKALTEATEQLGATQEVLSQLAETWKTVRYADNSADRALWINGLASLLEAAIRMQPIISSQSEQLRIWMQNIVSGNFEIMSGKGLIAYFSHQPNIHPSADVVDHALPFITEQGPESIGLMAAITGNALDMVDNPESPIREEWGKLLQWSLAQSDSTLLPANPQEDGVNDRGGQIRSSHPELQSAIDSDGIDLNDGVTVDVGTLLDSIGYAPASFAPGDTRLNQMNIGIVGDLGTGKTQLLRALVAGIREKSEKTQQQAASFLIFDYKGDYQDPKFLARVGGVVIQPENMPLNVFMRSESHASTNIRKRAMEFFDVISRIYKNVGAVQRQRFSKATLDAFASNPERVPMLGEVLNEYENLGKPDSVSSILSDFVYGNVFTEDQEQLIEFSKLMENQVVVINIHALGSDQTMKNSIVVLFLNLYFDYMKNTKKPSLRKGATIPQVRTINSYLLIDEANNIMRYNFEVLQQTMLESREFGFGVILSSQYLSHFEASGINYAEPLNTWFIHKVPDVTPKQLMQLGLPDASQQVADRIKTQENLCSYYSSFGFRGRFISDNPYYKVYGDLDE